MEYSTFVPDLRLQPFIACYWTIEGSETAVQKVIPDGSTELIFHYGDAYKVSRKDEPETLQSFSIAAGQMDNPLFLRPLGVSGILGVKFKPLGMHKLLKCDMHALTNQTLSLTDLLGKVAEILTEEIRMARSHQQRLAILEMFLLKRLAGAYASTLEGTLAAIQESNGTVNIRELSHHAGLSARTLERLFLQQVGVSAKRYARFTRFCHIYKLLNQWVLTKAEATYLSGYFDQAHFNKEFREFTGENPVAYFSGNHGFSNFFLNR